MTLPAALGAEARGPVRFLLQAEELTSTGASVRFKGNVDVSAETADEARGLIREFCDYLCGRAEVLLDQPVKPRSSPHRLDSEPTPGLVKRKMFEREIKATQLAALLGVNDSSISNFLRGKAKLSPENTRKLLEWLENPQERSS